MTRNGPWLCDFASLAGMMPGALRRRVVLVVDDEPMVAALIQRFLSSAGYEVRPPVHDPAEFSAALEAGLPDVLLLDVDLGVGRSGIDLAGTVPLQVPIVFVSGHSDGATLAEAVKLRPAGYVVKPFTPQQLVAAVDVAAAQSTRASLSPAVDLSAVPELAALSSRERDVVVQLLQHQRVPAIAQALFVSHHTVRNHLKHIFTKLSVRSQQELLDRVKGAVSKSS